MRDLLLPPDGGEAFLRAAQVNDFSMEEALFEPSTGERISEELEIHGMLYDYNEENSTDQLYSREMPYTRFIHRALNSAVSRVEGEQGNHLPFFSVRVFEEAEIGTTIHRNHYAVKPWAIGLTLRGSAPFNVYEQDQLPPNMTFRLRGTSEDPTPFQSMDASAGAGWALYTKNRQAPHSSGLVTSGSRRELILFYGHTW